MDVMASSRWFNELGMDDYKFINQCEINYIAADFTAQNLQQSFSGSGSSVTETSDQTSTETPTKSQKTNYRLSSSMASTDYTSQKPSSPTPQFLSFESSADINSQQYYRNIAGSIKPKEEAASAGSLQFQPMADPFENNIIRNIGTKRSYSMTRSPAHAQDHIIAERKRREKLSQRFIALSAIVPGLKKMDKASVLGDAIKYVKTLQERVAELEEQTKKRRVESAVLVKKSQISAADESYSCDENSNNGQYDLGLPEIEVRASDKDVLIRIHCKKQQGILLKILAEIENLHLSILNSSALPFGNSSVDITITAKMESEFSMTMNDLVRKLRLAFPKFM